MSFNWSTLQTIYATIEAIAKEIRKDYRRKSRQFVSVISKEFLTAITTPLNRLIRFRSTESLRIELISLAVRKIQLMILEIERFYETKYIVQLRELADQLMELVPNLTAVQLELFGVEEYIKNVTNRPVFKSFRAWLNRFDWESYRVWKEQHLVRVNSVKVYQPSIRGCV